MLNELIFRKANADDIISIVELIWNDVLRKNDRPSPSFEPAFYLDRFNKITNDENQYLLVVEASNQEIVATSHLTLLNYLPFLDKRVVVEFVRVKAEYKGQGIGRQMFEWIENKSKSWNANMIQLTTDVRREDAKAFYHSLGYEASHIGMKLILKNFDQKVGNEG